jgi:hypothetical protein
MAGKLDLTPARLRVLTSAAEGHIKRSGGVDVHAAVRGKACCELGDYQNVIRQVAWLDLTGLIEEDPTTRVSGPRWTRGSGSFSWRPTSAGWAALGRHPS